MIYLQLLATGLLGGFLAGLLGIGGGFVVVPVLMLLLPAFGVASDLVPQVAVATSLAAMVPMACSAVLAQHRRGGLDLAWVKQLAPGAAFGAVVGSQLAAAVHGVWVAAAFAIYVAYFAVRMMRGSATQQAPAGSLALWVGTLPAPAVAVLIGAFSAVAGVGGASMTIPFLLAANVDMKRAVAVSSAVGLVIALAGGASFAMTPQAATALSPALLGLVCWPAALTLAASAVVMAPRGVAASHRLPVRHLKRAFGAVLIFACASSLVKATEAVLRLEAAVPAGVVSMR
ncbi:MAG: sulfite exporter TauE/SafE family protein [Betaproteobacteria bacterium]